jgi:hypothetical protein
MMDAGMMDAGEDSPTDAGSEGGCSQGPVAPVVLAPMVSAVGPAVANASNVYFVGRSGSPPNDYSIQAASKNGGAPTTIVGPTTEIDNLAIDGDNVYFTTPGSVLRCPLTGCGGAPSVVASLQVNPYEIVTNGSAIYYTTLGATAILTCPVTGCGSSPTVFADTGAVPLDIATDGTHLYWTSVLADAGTSGGSVSTCPLTGCTGAPTLLAGGQYLYNTPNSSLSTDGANVYWINASGSGTIVKCAVGGCGGAPTVLGPVWGNVSYPTYADGAYVYWADYGAVYRCLGAGCSSMPTQVYSGPAGGKLVSADASGLYFLQKPGYVGPLLKCPPCGCSGDPVAAVPANSPNNQAVVQEVVTDGAKVYWVDPGDLQTPPTLYACDASQCSSTKSVVYSPAPPWADQTLTSVLAAGPDLYFFQGGQLPLAPYGSVNRCSKSGCSGNTALTPYGGAPYSVGGTLAGLPAGSNVTLASNGDQLMLSANGTFVFPTPQASGSTYTVDITAQPGGWGPGPDAGPPPCTAFGSTGTVGNGNVTSVLVNCASQQFAVGGTLSGWLPGKVILHDNALGDVAVSAPGTFAFPTLAAGSTSYNVTVLTQPVGATCMVSGGGGGVAHNTTSITVTCGLTFPSGLATDGAFFYWANSGSPLVKMPVGGGAPQALTPGVDVSGASTVIGGGNLYFSVPSNGTIAKVPLAGGAPTLLATGQTQNPSSLVLNGTTLYWSANSEILSLDLGADAGTVTTIANSPGGNGARRIAVGNGFLYWVSTDDAVMPYDDSIQRAALGGGAPEPVVTGQFGLGGGIVVVGAKVFFTGSLPELMYVAQ